MTSKTTVALKVPNLEELCLINCKVNPAALQDPIIKTLFHCQILTCRLIICTIKCCIASPSIQNVGDSVHVIISKQFFYKGKLQKYLHNLKIQFNDPVPVHSRIYVACLKYTFTFKLAPVWISVGKYFLHTSNLLPLKSGIDALEWNIWIKDNYSKLEIIPMILNLSPLSLECLPLTPSILDNFITNPNNSFDTIDLTLLRFPWVYVLPKLTRAKIVSISRILPASCPFENYNDLRRHWKNMYSYRLPKTKRDMLFYEVVFSLDSKERFTYPEMCILFKKPEVLMSVNRDEITNEFITALHSKIHSVCNEVIKIGHLLPGWNMDYQYTMKRKRNNYDEIYSYQLKSPFFKDDFYPIGIFKGFDKMSKYMRNHTQHVLSIMQNQQRKRIPVVQNKIMMQRQSQYITPTATNNEKNCSSSPRNKNSIEYSLLLQQRRSPVNNVNNTFSYYSSTPMYPKSCGKSCTIDLKTDSDSNQLYNRKPYMKKVESVRFDLTGFKKNTKSLSDSSQSILKFEKRLEKSKEYNQDCIIENLYYETNYTTPCNTLNPHDKTTDNFLKNFHQNFNLQISNSIIRSKISAQNKKWFETPLATKEINLEDGKSEFDNELHARISKFDQLYQMHQEDENEKSEFSEFDYKLIKELYQETPECNKNVKSPYISNTSKDWSTRNFFQNVHSHERIKTDSLSKTRTNFSESGSTKIMINENIQSFQEPYNSSTEKEDKYSSNYSQRPSLILHSSNASQKNIQESQEQKSYSYNIKQNDKYSFRHSQRSPSLFHSSSESLENIKLSFQKNIQEPQENKTYNYNIEQNDKYSSDHSQCSPLSFHPSNASLQDFKLSQEQKSYNYTAEKAEKYFSNYAQHSPLICHASNVSQHNINKLRCDHSLCDKEKENCYKVDSLSFKINSEDQTQKIFNECTQKVEEFDVHSFYDTLKKNLYRTPQSLSSISYLNSEGSIKKKFKQEHTSPVLKFNFEHEMENKSKSTWDSLKKT